MSSAPDDDVSEVLRLLRERAGMAPESLGASRLAHAVRRRVSAGGAESPLDYARRLMPGTDEFLELLDELVVPETWFFRDPLAFGELKRFLGAWGPKGLGSIRLLSAGCSTGEEAYSLAIALREAGFGPARFFILGTDVSRRSLDSARKGTFSPRSFRGPEGTIDGMRSRWFERQGESWRIRDELRESVEFRWGNLAQGEFLSSEARFQVVFCRNVLIYFHSDARRAAVGHLRRLLGPDGFLCSAPAEAHLFAESGFSGLGGECPSVFRSRDQAVPPLPSAAIARKSPIKPPLVVGRLGWIDNPPSSRSDEETAGRAILKTAQQAADDGRLEAADALCGRLLAQDPANAEAHYLQGVVRQAQGMPAEAQRSLEKALYLDPRHYQALVQMMLLAEQRGDESVAANFRRRARRAASEEAERCDAK